MTDLPIAETPEALTPDWLTDALTAGGHLDGARVVEATSRPLGTGQMCDSFRVALRYDRDDHNGPAGLVAKLPSADPTSRSTAVSMRSYEKEVRFYQQLAPQLPVATPTAFHADIDPPSGAFTLHLEDLAPAEQGDQLAGCDVDLAVAAVAELVKLHAPRWGDPTLVDLEWLHGDREAGAALMATLLPALWAGFQERYDTEIDAAARSAGEVLFTRIERYLTPTGGPTTVVHGDFRLDNLLVDAEAAVVRGVVDWQTCAVGPALHDVAYFIGAGLLPDVRRDVEADLVAGYHRDLLAAGITGYSTDTCWTDYRRGTFAGLLMAVAASMLVERTDRGDQMFMTMASRHAAHVLDLEAIDLLV